MRSIDGEPSLVERLMEMGVTPGTPIRLVRRGDPVQLMVRGYLIALRRVDAARILVAP